MGQRGIAFALGRSAQVFNALQAVFTVTVNVVSLSELISRGVTGEFADNTVANVVTVLVRLVISTCLALGRQLSR